jgi:hypothetical protein
MMITFSMFLPKAVENLALFYPVSSRLTKSAPPDAYAVPQQKEPWGFYSF